ncbi:MAG TPA: ABC transporter ATP-binding protein [Planctomycetaceae bacterium]|nr:ABC transporter ATP-binding protein [Planctomycetaceae bacterium]
MTLVRAENVGVQFVLRRRVASPRSGLFRLRRSGRVRNDSLWALRRVSFEVQEGEVLGLIGSNGAGKSTLCRVLAGILRPDEGRVEVACRSVPLLSLQAGFEKDLSARENIRLAGTLLGFERRRLIGLIPQVLKYAELEEFAEQPLRTFSSGMRARLGFAIASLIESELIVLDEVLGVGDAAFRRKSSARIQAMIDRARAVVLVSHSEKTVERLCHNVLWLEHGRVMEYGPAARVCAAYQRWGRSRRRDGDDCEPEPSQEAVELPVAGDSRAA